MARTDLGDEVPLEGLERAPEIYVDGIQGAVAGASVSKFNFFVVRQDPNAKKVRKLAAITLAIGHSELRAISSYLTKVADDVEAALQNPEIESK